MPGAFLCDVTVSIPANPALGLLLGKNELTPSENHTKSIQVLMCWETCWVLEEMKNGSYFLRNIDEGEKDE